MGPHPASTVRIAFDALDAIPADTARYGDEAPIGEVEGDAAQGTLERFLLDRHGDGTLRASYAAPVLVEAGVCLYLPRRAGGGAAHRTQTAVEALRLEFLVLAPSR